MAHPGIVDGGDGLQIWRVAVNILISCSAQPRKEILPIGCWEGG